MIFTCKQVANALAKSRYYELPWYRRGPMFFHIGICKVCGKYHKQVITMQKGMKEFIEHENAGDLHPDVKLSDNAKNRIHEAIDKAGR